jgi:hypothetical protein
LSSTIGFTLECHYRQNPGALDSFGGFALVGGAIPGYPPGNELAALVDETPQKPLVPVIDVFDLVFAKVAKLFSSQFRHGISLMSTVSNYCLCFRLSAE